MALPAPGRDVSSLLNSTAFWTLVVTGVFVFVVAVAALAVLKGCVPPCVTRLESGWYNLRVRQPTKHERVSEHLSKSLFSV